MYPLQRGGKRYKTTKENTRHNKTRDKRAKVDKREMVDKIEKGEKTDMRDERKEERDKTRDRRVIIEEKEGIE